jgi:hypothetical protein
MAQLLVKIELEGTPDHDAYVMLDQYMSSHFWERIRRPGQMSDLEHAMYIASTFGDRPNLTSMAHDLKRNIEFKVWNRARIFMVQPQNWIETA